MKACINCEGSGDDCFDPKKNPALRREVKAARKSMIPDNYIERVISFAQQGYKEIDFNSRPTTPIGIRKPICRSRARTRTIPCA